MKALIFNKFGDPNVLKYEDVEEPIIGPKDLLVEMKAVGLNFADIYRRRGEYHLEGNPPYILGYEGAGIVKAVGELVTSYKTGDRIGFADVPFSNAEYVCVNEDKAIPLPDEITYEIAATVLLQGLTADFLVNDCFHVKAGHHIAMYAVSGGVGQLLLQMLKLKGAVVYGLTSSEEKRKIALDLGADKVFLHSENWKQDILMCTKEQNGVDAVYDSIGTTLQDSFEITKQGGTIIFFGMAGGKAPLIDPMTVFNESKTLVGGDLWYYLSSKEERIKRSGRLFGLLLSGKLIVQEPMVFNLSDGVKAHEILENSKSTGKIIYTLSK